MQIGFLILMKKINYWLCFLYYRWRCNIMEIC